MIADKFYFRCRHVLKFFGFFLIINSVLFSDVDLEVTSQDFVLETKRIQIPGHLHAFNPSIIRWKEKLIMSFREIPFPYDHNHCELNSAGESRIGIVLLDENFNAISAPQMIVLDDFSYSPMMVSRSEDARLVSIGEKLYLVYSDNKDLEISAGGFRMYIAELDFDGEIFHVKSNECLSRFEGEKKDRREKNWVPFDFHGHFLFAYSLVPHRILMPILGTGTCETVVKTKAGVQWNWGELRGGTPALQVDNFRYLAFFHSSKKMSTCHSKGRNIDHYFIGAYTFLAYPPFDILQISREPIVGKNFYHGITYTPYWKPVRVVFPCGYIFDDHYIWIAYGRQDHEIWIVKLDKQGLMDSLVPVNYD